MKHSMEIGDYLNEIVIAGGGVVGALTAWKQGQKTAKTSHLDNVEKAIDIWQKMATNLEGKLDGLESEIRTLKDNHEECEKSKKMLTDKVNEMERVMHNIIQTPVAKRKYTKGSGGANSDQ
tara:strand:- start:3101 stop:3463 length:363 start_codon:yes stop_codon:yes gene_type:complete